MSISERPKVDDTKKQKQKTKLKNILKFTVKVDLMISFIISTAMLMSIPRKAPEGLGPQALEWVQGINQVMVPSGE